MHAAHHSELLFKGLANWCSSIASTGIFTTELASMHFPDPREICNRSSFRHPTGADAAQRPGIVKDVFVHQSPAIR
jgi:hypothetical protein